MPNPARLRWHCRRGTKELDDVLTRFLETGYPRLTDAEQAVFESLLDEQDPDLAAWILGGREPPPRWRSLIDRIREGLRPA